MNLEELTRKAQDGFLSVERGDRMRGAVLAVLAEVRQCVPEEETQVRGPLANGWNLCRRRMLRRLDRLEGE